MPSASNIFDQVEKDSIVHAIKELETKTSGEIRVHVENRCNPNPLDRAVELFYALGMDKTRNNNGILLYIAVKDHRFSIIGDKGINKLVSEDFWEEIRHEMSSRFTQKEYVKGVLGAISKSGNALIKYFPKDGSDPNELPDDISFNENE